MAKNNSKELQRIANVLRKDVISMTTVANSGHPTSCLSCAEIISTLYFNEMKWDVKNSKNMNSDEFVLSKGHSAPILYSALFRAGAVKEPLSNLRKFKSQYEGHPVPRTFPWVKVATGSLGQGLSNAVGMAYGHRFLGRKNRVFCLLGDGEITEGSVWEAMQIASEYKLDNLVAIVDVNKFGLAGPTMVGHNTAIYKKRFDSFGAHTIIVDGHNITELKKAFLAARKVVGKPVVILAKTLKGKGVSFLENKDGWHGKVLSADQKKIAFKEIGSIEMPKIIISKPRISKSKVHKLNFSVKPSYVRTTSVATRKAYGNALVQFAKKNEQVLAIDAEVKHSTYAEDIETVDERQFVEAYIAEQNMVGMAAGMAAVGVSVFASTFAAFFSRAFDQIRVAAISGSQFTLVGSHAGISIGEDGATQMGLEDIGLFRSQPDTCVVYPSDAVSCEKLLVEVQKHKGLRYVRTSRPKTAILYDSQETFPLGGFKVFEQSAKDSIVIVGAGITLHEALHAQALLTRHKINVTVVDLYSIKPFNVQAFDKLVGEKPVVVVEDHYRTGGIGEMLASSGFYIDEHLFVDGVPHSGREDQLLKHFSLDAGSIVKVVKELL